MYIFIKTNGKYFIPTAQRLHVIRDGFRTVQITELYNRDVYGLWWKMFTLGQSENNYHYYFLFYELPKRYIFC